MAFIPFAAAVSISYLGLAAGVLIALGAKDELATGKKFFVWLQKAIILAVVLVALSFLHVQKFIIAIAIVAAAFLIFKFSSARTGLAYSVFAVFAFLASQNQQALLASSSLVFLFGLPTGSIYYAVNQRRGAAMAIRALLARNSPYVVVALLLYTLYSLLVLKQFRLL